MASSQETPKPESCDSQSSSTHQKHGKASYKLRSKRRRSAMAAAAEEEEEGKTKKASPLFTQEEEILLLKELQQFRKMHGVKNRWKAFYEASKLRPEYFESQITEKMRRLKDKFERSKRPPPLSDPCESRIYQLSKSLWGKSTAKARVPLSDPKHLTRLLNDSPELLRNRWGLIGSEAAMEFEKRCADLFVKELELLHEKLSLKLEIGKMLLETINGRDVSDVESSSSSGLHVIIRACKCKLRPEYFESQITEKMRRLKDKFERSKRPPPLSDPCESRIYQLSKSLWGKSTAKARVPLSDPKHLTRLLNDSPELLRNRWGLIGSEAAMEFEKRCADLFVKELELLHEKLSLKLEIGKMLLETINGRDVSDVESSSSSVDVEGNGRQEEVAFDVSRFQTLFCGYNFS